MQYIDLTQTLKMGIPDWDGCCGFQISDQIFDPDICVQSISTPLGIGTHMDAPCHMVANAQDVASIPLENFFTQAIVIDVAFAAHADYFLQVADIQAFEKQYGTIPRQALVLLRTGWAKYWSNPDRYRNVQPNGMRRFPGFSVEAAEYLLTKNILGIGIDTLSPDGGNTDFPVHKAILGSGKYILENICNLELLPPKGAEVIVLPIKIENASESPTRVVARV